MRMREDDKSWDFDSWAGRYDEAVAADSLLYARYDGVLDAGVKMAKVRSGRRVLDIGTGTGNVAVRCLARGAAVVGLDPSEGMLARACEKIGGDSGAEFRRVDEPFLHAPYPSASFGAVVSTYAYHHIPHRLKPDSVREMIRVLKPGGSWALGDLAFENEKAEREALREYRWLEEEYFVRIDDLRPVFAELAMELSARQFTLVTWVLWAVRPGRAEGDQAMVG